VPIGNQPTVAGLNNDLTQLATQMRDLMGQVTDFNLRVAALGATGLENLGGTGLGFSAADASAFLNMAAILNTPAAVYFGNATQASEYNFNSALCPVWAGG
jgi:hypothetical protein